MKEPVEVLVRFSDGTEYKFTLQLPQLELRRLREKVELLMKMAASSGPDLMGSLLSTLLKL